MNASSSLESVDGSRDRIKDQEPMPTSREGQGEPSPEKLELLRLEAEGKWVFHGTGVDVDTLEPRQSVDTQTGPDGDPAVFASDRTDYAIFMAIINRRNFAAGIHSRVSRYGHDDGDHEYVYFVPEGALDQIDDSADGWVYVYPRESFQKYKKPGEFISEAPVAPAQKILVRKRDLPKGIKAFE